MRVGEEALEQGQIRGAAEARARELADELMDSSAMVATVETSPRMVHPKAPFITSTLQQTAYNRLGYTSQRTMKLAQQLYEGMNLGEQGSVGLITYMRTDSPRLADEAVREHRGHTTGQLPPAAITHHADRRSRGPDRVCGGNGR